MTILWCGYFDNIPLSNPEHPALTTAILPADRPQQEYLKIFQKLAESCIPKILPIVACS